MIKIHWTEISRYPDKGLCSEATYQQLIKITMEERKCSEEEAIWLIDEIYVVVD